MMINYEIAKLVGRKIIQEQERTTYFGRCICSGMSSEEIKARLPKERSVVVTLEDLLNDTLAHVESILEKAKYKK